MAFKLTSLVANAVNTAVQQASQPSYYDDPYAQQDMVNWAPETTFAPPVQSSVFTPPSAPQTYSNPAMEDPYIQPYSPYMPPAQSSYNPYADQYSMAPEQPTFALPVQSRTFAPWMEEPLNIDPGYSFVPPAPEPAPQPYVDPYPVMQGDKSNWGVQDPYQDLYAGNFAPGSGNGLTMADIRSAPGNVWQGLQDWNTAIEERGRETAGMSSWDLFTNSGGSGIYNATGYDVNRLPGPTGEIVSQTLSPATLLTAGFGGALGTGIRSALPGTTGRAAANLVEPIAGGGIASRLAGETAINTGAIAGSELANEYIPEGPWKAPLTLGAGLLAGGVAAGAATKGGLSMYQAPRSEMVFGTGRTGVPRTVVPESIDYSAGRALNAERTALIDGAAGRGLNAAERARVAELERQIAALPALSAPQPLANERLWFHSTNDNSFDLLDPDKSVGTSTGITQGPGVYMAADPAKSAGKYGERTFVSEFDGNVLDLTRKMLPDEPLFDGGASWRDIQAALIRSVDDPEAKAALAAAFEPINLKQAAMNTPAEMKSIDFPTANSYVFRQALVDALEDNLDEIPDSLLGRFKLDNPEADVRALAAVQNTLAENGVDALFHHSPRADGDVLIVLNGEAARTLGETRNASGIVSSGKSWPEIVAATRKSSKVPPAWRVEQRDDGRFYVVNAKGVEHPDTTIMPTRGYSTRAQAEDQARLLQIGFERPEIRSYGRAKPQGLRTNLEPSTGATEDFGVGVPFFRRSPDPAERLTEAMNNFTPGERPATGLLRQYDGAVKTAGLEMVEDWQNGSKRLLDMGLARRSAGQTLVNRTPDMEALFKALHGEGPVPARLQGVYDDIKRLVDLEAKATEDFDPNFVMRDDYFYRGWRAPQETNAGTARGGVGAKPGYAKPRTDATFTTLLDEGWEPVSWNPYDMLAMRRMAGVTFREQKTMVQRMLDLDVGLKVDGPVPEGYRIPRIGPAFEGKPYAYTANAKPADAMARLDSGGDAARLGFTDRIAVPDGVANVLEELFGTRGRDWTVGGFNASKAWRGSTGGLKRIKLLGSVFQQVDFATRASFAQWAGVIDDVLAGKPLSAVAKAVKFPAELSKLAWANTSSGRRAALRRQILSEEPIIAGRPGLTLKAISEQGWSTQDISIINRNAIRDLTEAAMKDPPTGARAVGTYPLRKARQIDRAMTNGLFDGVYPQAQIISLKNYVVPRLARQHPDWSDARIAASAATEINKMFSTLGPWQTVMAGAPQGFKDFTRGILFSTNETESLIRQAFSTVKGPNKQMWITYYAGGALFLAMTANAIHYAATGEPLPLDRYKPLEKDENNPLGYRYNSSFMSPEVPGIKGRGGFPVDLDLMGQMDTIFRMLDPKAFMDARFSVPVRAGLNQYTSEDFYGRKLDTPQERVGQLASDLFMPIGAGQFAGAAGIGPENEQRLGALGQAIQGAGVNLRARSNADLRDAAAQEKYGRPWEKLEPFERNDLLKASPNLKEELDTRRDTGVSQDQPWAINSAAMEGIKTDRLADEEEASRLLESGAKTPQEFRDMVGAIQSEAAARSKQARIAAGWDPANPTNANEAALSAYYNAFDVARLPGGGVDFDVLDRELARLEGGWTAEQKGYIDRNTGLAEHAPGVQELYDARETIRASGYWDLRDTAWTELNAQSAAPGYQPGQSFEEYKRAIIAEAVAGGVPEWDAEEVAMSRHPVLSKFNDAYKRMYLYPWADAHPDETIELVKWEYLNPDAKLERYLTYLEQR